MDAINVYWIILVVGAILNSGSLVWTQWRARHRKDGELVPIPFTIMVGLLWGVGPPLLGINGCQSMVGQIVSIIWLIFGALAVVGSIGIDHRRRVLVIHANIGERVMKSEYTMSNIRPDIFNRLTPAEAEFLSTPCVKPEEIDLLMIRQNTIVDVLRTNASSNANVVNK